MKHILNTTTWLISVGIIIATAGLSIYVAPSMPEMMASHWNASGEVNGYISQFWGLYMMPMIALGLLFLFAVIPLLDPLKKNFSAYKDAYNEFVLVLLLFLSYIHAASLVWNLGVEYDMSRAVVFAIGFLFIFIARVLRKAKRNWFVGIRTPWTLSSDEVWDKTHVLGARLFEVSGVAMIGVLFLLPTYIIQALFFLVFGTFITLFVYSFVLYKKLEQPHDREI